MNTNKKRAVPAWKRSAINSAVIAAITGFCVSPVFAGGGCVITDTVSTSIATPCLADENATVTISSTGAIQSASAGNQNDRGVYFTNNLAGSLTNDGLVSTSAYGAAYGVLIQNELTGTLTNNGAINSTVDGGTNSDYARAYGIYEGSSTKALAGTLINSGTIAVDATASATQGSALAEGVHVANNLAGSLINSGSLTVTSEASPTSVTVDAYAQSYGILVGNALSGQLTNSGTITADSVANLLSAKTSDYAQAYAMSVGIATDSISQSGSLTNSHTINASSQTTFTGARAYDYAYQTAYSVGILTGDVAGTLTNAGVINATSSATVHAPDTYTYAYAYLNAEAAGIFAGTVTGSLINSGSINATGNSVITHGSYDSVTGAVSAFGLGAGNVYGELINRGTINATATVSTSGSLSGAIGGDAFAYGLSTYDVSGNVANSGTITATASSTVAASGDVYTISKAVGIYTGSVSGTLLNSGAISAAVNANSSSDFERTYAYAYAYGIASDTLSGTLTNSGTISVVSAATAASDEDRARATTRNAGIYTGRIDNGTLTNSGLIDVDSSVTANGYLQSRARGASWGIYSNSISGALTNSGTIDVATNSTSTSSYSYAYAYADTYGIQAGSLLGTLTNSGTINVVSNATATALNSYSYAYAYAYGVEAGSLSGTLTNSGTINVASNATATVALNSYSYAYAYAFGITAGTLSGTLTNSGHINVSATSSQFDGGEGYSSSMAFGISTGSILASGSLINSNTGIISATAVADGNSGAAGIMAAGTVYGTLANYGSITATSQSTEGGISMAVGISAYELLGKLDNQGTITATASSPTGYANAIGISEGSGGPKLAGTLSNSGVIRAEASGDYAAAYGIVIYRDIGAEGQLNNTGSIIGNANTTPTEETTGVGVQEYMSSSAYGIFVSDELLGTINNSGVIKATVNGVGNANAYSIYVSGGSGPLVGADSTFVTTESASLTIASAPGTINNAAGGLLSGNLYISGNVNVNNAGTIAIPADAMVASTNNAWIQGNYTQQTGGIFETTALSKDLYGQMVVDGQVDLTGSNTVAVRARPGAAGTVLAVGDKLDNVLTAGTWKGLASGGTINAVGTPLYNYYGYEDGAGNIDITITGKNKFCGVVSVAGSLCDTLDGLDAAYTGTGVMDPLVDALYGANSKADLNRGVQELSPLVSLGLSQATGSVLQSVNRIIQARQDANLGLSSGDQFFGNRSIWFKPFGSRASQGNRDDAFGYNARLNGMAFGADGEISDTTRIGGAFTYAHTNVDMKSDADQSGSINSYQAIVYGSYSLDDNTEINAQADYSSHDNSVSRQTSLLSSTVARGKYDSWGVHLGAGIGRIYNIGEVTSFTPSVRFDYTSLHNEGYTESGAGILNLRTKSNTAEELVFLANGRLVQGLGDGISAIADLGVGYDALAKRSSITSSFVSGGAAFSTDSINPSPWLVRGGLGLTMINSKAMEISARYDIEARPSNYNNQTLSLKLRMPF